ncbi:type II secretion system F family protein [Planctomonas psychrotolerans]|uniref:type II secretion system F family protein n=1 Tax=Planctomonas psychrotolerans TaxID=2528712 RepID=UPI00123923DA|nr:type II secretion system F family protein [Planctomonas psychrotolerans]
MRSLRRRPSAEEPAYPLEEVAAVADRLAVLLGAGVPPASAWHHLSAAAVPVQTDPGVVVPPSIPSRIGAGGGDTGGGDTGGGWWSTRSARQRTVSTAEVVRRVADATAEGASIADAMHDAAQHCPPRVRSAWSALAVAWAVATKSGAPLARSLTALADSFRSVAQIERDLAVALAGPVATARMVLALPAVGILFGTVLGFDTLRVLFATPLGSGCLLLGAALMVAAGAWNRHLIRAATPREAAPGLGLDLLAIAVSGGQPLADARRSVTAAGDRFLPAVADDAATIDEVAALAERAGIPAAGLLRGEADQVRRAARTEGRQHAETASAALMLPLGICVLPAFLVVGVVPLLISVMSSTGLVP